MNLKKIKMMPYLTPEEQKTYEGWLGIIETFIPTPFGRKINHWNSPNSKPEYRL